MAPDALERPDAEHEGSRSDDVRTEELLVRLEQVRMENQQLRAEYARARTASHRRAAIGLAGVGIVAILGGLVLPDTRDILIAVGAIGLFSAVLTAYLTPERFVPATVGELTYRQHSRTLSELIDVLELSEERQYVPTPEAPDGNVALFVPEHPANPLPPAEELDGPLVVPIGDGGRGMAIRPTGEGLLEELDDAGDAAPRGQVADAADLAAEALVETFELAGTITPEFDFEENRATFAVSDTVYGPLDRVDHPIPSTLGCALARATDEPVTLDVSPGDERADWLVSCTWDETGG